MLTILILAPIFLILFVLTRLLRLLFFPFHHHHQGWRGYRSGWNRGWNRYDYNPYNRPRFGGLASILVLVALERLFDRRW